jgi:hypothetical protein
MAAGIAIIALLELKGSEPMFPADNCTQCDEPIYGGPTAVTEYYLLTHTYLSKNPDGVTANIVLTDEPVGTFCGSKCLVQFVNAKIAPDALGE